MEIKPNVHVIPGGIVNVYLIVESDGLTLIDTGLSGSARTVLKYITGLGKQPADLKRIILTHSDGDHVGALAALKAATGARAYANPIEAQAIEAGTVSRDLKVTGLLALLFRTIVGPLFKAKAAHVDELINDGDVLPILGGLRVIATIGHTPGHISLYAPTHEILFSGDEADAGIVYTSDVTPQGADRLIQLGIPDQYNVLATYPIAVLKSALNADLARAFMDYVLSAQGQAVLQKWGFIPAKP